MVDQQPYILFYVVMGFASLGWVSLLVFPRKNWANFWVAGISIPLILSLVYIYALATFWFRTPQGDFLEFLKLSGVHDMFANRGLLLVAWINILVADLALGAWMARKAAQVRMPYVYLAPCLLLTFGFAGVGFILFSILVAFGNRWPKVAEYEDEPRKLGWN